MESRIRLLTTPVIICSLWGCNLNPLDTYIAPKDLPIVEEREQVVTEATTPQSAKTEPTKTANIPPIDDDAISLIDKSIALLAAGKVQKAQQKLSTVLSAQPDNKLAKHLIEQIHANPQVYFGSEHFFYTVKNGDSMTGISEKFTKNHINFYILSRYNGIDNPSSIRFGQKLKIPLRYKGNYTTKHQVDELVEKAKGLIRRHRYTNTIKLIEGSPKYIKDNAKIQELLFTAYLKKSKSLEKNRRYKLALSNLQKAFVLTENKAPLIPRMAKLDNISKAHQLYTLAKAKNKSGDYEESLSLLEESIELYPNFKDAIETASSIKRKLVSSYHINALKLFKDRQLNEAIDYWNKILILEPENQTAATYRDRSLKMQQKM